MKVAILGVSGFAGTELARLCVGHPELEVVMAAARGAAGRRVAERTPALGSAYPELVIEEIEPGRLGGMDVVFCALPHGESQRLVPQLHGRVGTVVDLAADFRLRDPAAYPAWYGMSHGVPSLLGEAVYALPELHRHELQGASLLAVPGCYPTAAVLALAPLVRSGIVDPGAGMVVDAASGVSGAGRSASEELQFAAVDGSVRAYGLLDHRHTPEMEQELGGPVLFTPHVAPMSRGILATCYARRASGWGRRNAPTNEALEILREAYAAEPFVRVVDEPPATKDTAGSNCALVTARVDDRTGWVLALCALDNLGKGAAGQAVQALNCARGLPETTGLPAAGVYP